MAVSNVFDWFVYNEVSIEYGEGKTDSIAFASNKFQYSRIKMRNKNKIFFFNFHPLINNSISKLVLICQCKKKLQWDN